MIAVDASALLTVLRQEEDAQLYSDFLRQRLGELVISTPGFVEATIAAERRLEGTGGAVLMANYCKVLGVEIASFSESHMSCALEGFERFGQGRGKAPSALNFGDCLSYGFAMAEGIPLLFAGKDFTKTDVKVQTLK